MKGWKSSTPGRSPRPISKEMQFWYLSTPSLLVHWRTHNQATSRNSDDWCIRKWTSVKIIQGCTATRCVLCAHLHIKHTNVIWNVFLRYCRWRFAFCAVHLLTRGDLTDCHVTCRATGNTVLNLSPCPARPHQSLENIIQKQEETHIHTLTIQRWLLPKSHNNCVCPGATQVENYTAQSIANTKYFLRQGPIKRSQYAFSLRQRPISCSQCLPLSCWCW